MLQIKEFKLNRILRTCFKCFGLWFRENTSLQYKFYGFILHLTFSVLFTLLLLLSVVFVTTSVTEATQALCVGIPMTVYVAKMINFVWYSQKIHRSLETVYNFELNHTQEEGVVQENLKPLIKLSILYVVLGNLTIITAWVQVLFMDEYRLPFVAWYAIDWKDNATNYWLLYAYQVFSMMMAVNLNSCIEVMPCFLMSMASTMMELLGERICNDGYQSIQRKEVRKIAETKVQNDTVHEYVIIHQEVHQ